MDLEVGQTASHSLVFSQDDFDRFAELSGDDNPIHVDPLFAAKTRFGRTVCHGMLLYSTVCQALGSDLPGPGTVQLAQEMMFTNPTFAGDEINVRLEVQKLGPDQQTALIETNITRSDGLFSCQGQTLVTQSVGNFESSTISNGIRPVSQETEMKGLRLGQTAATRRAFTLSDLVDYTSVTGDTNPVFNGANFAEGAGLSGPMIPGGLIGGLFSYLLGTRLPGRGTNWLKQRLRFHKPAYPDEMLAATVKIIRFRPEKNLINLETNCLNAAGEAVCSGEALVLVKDLHTTQS